MKTILLSTSSLWNCGDDFIREGVQSLLNFREDTRILWWNRGFGISRSYANDISINLKHTDYFIVAGTPKWVFNNEHIYKHCLKHNTPMSLIGVGTRDFYHPSQYQLLKKVAKSNLCEICLARDSLSFDALNELGFKNVHKILDPCFFAPRVENKRTLNILGWRKQFHLDGDPLLLKMFPLTVTFKVLKNILKKKISHNMADKYNQYFLELFQTMPDPKCVVVHDNREIEEAEVLFGKDNVYYATNPKEMFQIFSKAKSYIGSRIHGAIPTFIHGGQISLIYTNTKSEVITQAQEILKTYTNDVDNFLHIQTFTDSNDDCLTVIPSEDQRFDAIQNAIDQEQLRTSKLIQTAPILREYLND